MEKMISLTGIKPSGTPHIGNYLGLIQPALELAKKYKAYYFIADYHALTTLRNGEELRRHTYEITATFLALGMNPDEVVFFRQSDVPEIFELMWILSCFTPKGLLNRAHAYKDSVAKNEQAGKEVDFGINAGLFNYPVLMAADILLYSSNVVPVGQDQKQHIEIARDIALAVNHTYNEEIFIIPEAIIEQNVASIPGLDGRKMSKSYDNVIPIFAEPKYLRQRIMQVVTDSRAIDEPKNPDEDNLYNIYKYFASPEQKQVMRDKYLHGGFKYGDVKQELYEVLEKKFGPARILYNKFIADTECLEKILAEGAKRARHQGSRVMKKIRAAVGVRYERS